VPDKIQPDHPVRDDIDLVAGNFYGGDPHEKWTWMRANAPVYFDAANGVWAITKYDDLKAISKNPELFSSAGGIRPDSPAMPMMIDTDDPEHFRRRKLVSRGFTPKQIRDQESKLVGVCDWIIDQVAEKGECDFVRDIAAPLPMIMIGDMLGVAPEDRDDLLRWSDQMLTALTGADSPEDMASAGIAFGEYNDYAERVIADRRENPRDDLVSLLVHAEVDGGRLDQGSLIMESLLILVGGDETTRHVISGGMYQLMVHDDQRARLLEDRSLLPGAVEEMLRWVSPIKNMARTVTRDTELRGQTLREGQKLMLFYPSANRDEEVFQNPFDFDIRREPNDHVAFGFGTHFCLGNSLARLEMRVMFERLLERLPDLQVRSDGEPAMRAANFVSGYETMPVAFTPAASLSTPAV
jgi:cytochrome P450 family 142 subfamily A polypeptide 1